MAISKYDSSKHVFDLFPVTLGGAVFLAFSMAITENRILESAPGFCRFHYRPPELFTVYLLAAVGLLVFRNPAVGIMICVVISHITVHTIGEFDDWLASSVQTSGVTFRALTDFGGHTLALGPLATRFVVLHVVQLIVSGLAIGCILQQVFKQSVSRREISLGQRLSEARQRTLTLTGIALAAFIVHDYWVFSTTYDFDVLNLNLIRLCWALPAMLLASMWLRGIQPAHARGRLPRGMFNCRRGCWHNRRR